MQTRYFDLRDTKGQQKEIEDKIAAAAKILRDAAIAHGAPEGCIQWIEYPSIEATSALMNHPGVSMILATGGSGMGCMI